MRLLRVCAPLPLALLLLGSPGSIGVARAEPAPAELRRARALFKEARQLEDAGRWGDALERLQRVAEVKMTPQVRFHLALCAENVGLWTQALDGYAQAVSEARGNAKDVEAEAGEHLRRLAEVIPTVSVRASGAAPGDVIYLDHKEISAHEGPPRLRVDPGPHTAELRRGALVLARDIFTVEPRATRQIELRVEPASADKPLEAPPLFSAAQPPPSSPAPPPPDQTTRVLGWAALGLGAAAGVTTGVFIGLRQGALAQLDMVCASRRGCDPSVQPIVDRGTLDATMVNVFGTITLVSVVGGAALLLTSPASARPTGRPTLTPAFGPKSAGLALRGSF